MEKEQIRKHDANYLRTEIEEMRMNRICVPYPSISKNQLQKDGIIIYGIGPMGKNIVISLLEHDINISWIVDKNEDLWDKEFLGIPIYPISSLANAGDRFVMLASTHVIEMATQSQKYNIDKWILIASVRDFCYIPGEIGICSNTDYKIEELFSGYDLLTDKKSQDIYMAYIRFHYTFSNNFSKLYDPAMYFPEDLKSQINYSSFVDIGAYTGDTLSDWLMHVEHKVENHEYFCFEPDYPSYQTLGQYVESLSEEISKNIHLQNIALGSTNKKIYVNSIDYNTNKMHRTQVLCKRLDDIFYDNKPTFIKADIEGNEIDMLEGAKETIKRCRPALAISVYHRYTDLWLIPKWIDNLNCGYDIYLRHHPKVFTDTVCYAIPK